MSFATPTRDINFSLYHMAGFDRLVDSGAFPELSEDLVSSIADEAAKFCNQIVAPLNWDSDRNGAKLDNGVVRTSPGFKDAYNQYVEGGWNALSFAEDVGGAGLPVALSAIFIDALNASCLSFAVGTTLTIGAAKAVNAVGTQEQKRLFLAKMISGEWTGAMNLTEPQAGSDLSAIRAKAEPIGDGKYKITGQKIFITYGDHDLTENIVHLVLAKLPGAPDGTAGISMFLVPKFHVDDDGTLGKRNDVHCVGLEEKLGIHGSPTCVMAFGESGECIGTLLGEENKGLKNMFIMMNSARLDVGLQGVGVAERAFQLALAYACDRKQGRAPGVRTGDMVPIYEHADVRRMLYAMKSLTEASRAICYANAVACDVARFAPDDEERRDAKAREELLTPISKAWSTDRANEITSIGVQVHGGMGFIEETGAAQHMRDARIAAIYEGANGIQAMDLVGRKLKGDGGAAAKAFISEVAQEAILASKSEKEEIRLVGTRLHEAVDALNGATKWLLSSANANQDDTLAGATPYIKLFGNVAGGFYLCRGARAAFARLEDHDTDQSYFRSKIAIAAFYAENYLTEAAGLALAVRAGAARLARLEPECMSS